ncbi:MAG: hypothetical protein IJW74_00710, partial [Oscillospiraceae bacterium]|nr:hypothetical protein [Oscillospiraceae bacterium]
MTAKWWAIQEKIKENEATPQDLYNDVLETVNKIISQRYSFAIGKNKFDSPLPYQEQILGKCPRCGGEVLENTKGFGCVNWPQPHNCKFVICKETLQFKDMGISIDTQGAKKLLKGEGIQLLTNTNPQKQLTVKMDDSQQSQYGVRLVVENSMVVKPQQNSEQAENTANID